MDTDVVDTASAWNVTEVEQDQGWRFELEQRASEQMATTVRSVFDPSRDLLDYEPADFDLGPGLDVVEQAITSAQTGRGLALIKGLPRDSLSAAGVPPSDVGHWSAPRCSAPARRPKQLRLRGPRSRSGLPHRLRPRLQHQRRPRLPHG